MTDEQITEGARSQGGKERMRFGALVETLALPNWKRVGVVKGPVKMYWDDHINKGPGGQGCMKLLSSNSVNLIKNFFQKPINVITTH